MMKQIFVEDPSKGPYLKEVPIPKPAKGEVLVKIMAATVMPIDNMMAYQSVFPTPYVLGPQGAGIIVDIGEGVPKSVIGKKAVLYSGLLLLAERKFQGLWTQYAARQLSDVYICDDSISFEQAAGMYGNPLTAMGVMRFIEKGKYKATIQSAACSEICKKVAMMHKEKGMPIINLVRGPENLATLKGLGEELVLDVKDPHFEESMKELIKKYQPDVFIDSVVDEVSLKVFGLMPYKATLVAFGALSKASTFPIPIIETLVNEKTVTGYYWSLEDHKKPREEIVKELDIVNKDLATGGKRFAAPIVRVYKMEDFVVALKEQPQYSSKGRCILKLNDY